jgi:hypothetical protein
MLAKERLFKDLAKALQYWTETMVEATTDPTADLSWTEDSDPYQAIQAVLAANKVTPEVMQRVFAEGLRGLAVSFLTIMDGGSALSEKGRLYVVDEDGARIGEGLHDDFVSHLIAIGRL